MAIATRTLKDTALESSGGAQGIKVTVLVNHSIILLLTLIYLTQVV